MTPEECVAEVLNAAVAKVDGDYNGSRALRMAEAAVAALRGGGWEITKLTKPRLGPDMFGHVEFSEGSDCGTVSTDVGSGVVWAEGWEWTVEQARDVAACWLAAAAAAQENQGDN